MTRSSRSASCACSPRACATWSGITTITDPAAVPQPALGDQLAGLALFADLSGPELEAVAHTVEEAWFPEGQRVLRQGFSGTGFYVIVDGEVAINIDGEERARLGRGDFFGEVSVLLGEAPVADVIALRPLRCLHLPGPALRDFLLAHPRVLLRMLVDQTRRLRNANQWRR